MIFERFKTFKLNLFFPKIKGFCTSTAPMYEPPLVWT